MTYIKNNQRYSLSQLKKDNPTVSFPKEPSKELLEEYGVTILVETERPEYNIDTQKLVESIVDGVQVWNIEDLPYNPELYKIQRKREYPQIEDYLDGIVKGDDAQIQEYINKCLAVKAKYPKG